MASGMKITGLDDYTNALGVLAGEVDEITREANEEFGDLVVTGARQGFPKMTGKGAGALVAEPDGGMTSVGYDVARAAHGPWIDFGGRVGRRDSILRPYSADGRYVIPTMRRLERNGTREDIGDRHLAAAILRSGLTVD